MAALGNALGFVAQVFVASLAGWGLGWSFVQFLRCFIDIN